jgi:N-acetylglucosaminyldiphosphoundecaprenol N-acetyl-beta-D-mannosaminyltransferase
MNDRLYNTRSIISLDISELDYNAALDEIIRMGQNRKNAYACFANVHMVIEAYENKSFAKQVNSATFVLADGVPLVKTLKFFYGVDQERVAGMDAMNDLIRLAHVNQMKIFFFGTTPELLESIRIKIEKEFPNANVAGLFSPPFDKPLDDESYVGMINGSGAQLVFVSLGCPKQEKWMATHSHKINAVLLGVGGAFPVFAGTVKRAPLFMRNMGLEWLFRFFQEPARLFKRYLKTNSMFIYLVLKFKGWQLWRKIRRAGQSRI